MSQGTARVKVGDVAPGFELDGTDGTPDGRRRYSLGEFAGRPVVLVFYPADNSPVCTVQLTNYSASMGELAVDGAQVLALSPQSVQAHEDFGAAQGGFAFPLLADVDKTVGSQYSILGPLGFYRRSIFVVGADGKIAYAHRSITSLTYQPVETIAAEIRKL